MISRKLHTCVTFHHYGRDCVFSNDEIGWIVYHIIHICTLFYHYELEDVFSDFQLYWMIYHMRNIYVSFPQLGPVWVRECCLRLPGRVNVFSHVSHWYGLSQMLFQSVSYAERFITGTTLVWPLPTMDKDMSLQSCSMWKWLCAGLTLVWPLPTMT